MLAGVDQGSGNAGLLELSEAEVGVEHRAQPIINNIVFSQLPYATGPLCVLRAMPNLTSTGANYTGL